MFPRRTFALFALLVVLLLPVIAFAQRGSGGRPIPSRTVTFDAGTRSFSTPEAHSGTPFVAPTWTPRFSLTTTLTPPTPSAQAEQAIIEFASDQLGVVVVPIYAGDLTSDIQNILQYLPANIQTEISGATTLSAATYWGLCANGAAMLAVGNCTNNPNCSLNNQNLSVQLSSASAGVYSLLTMQVVTTAQDGLNLIEATYPKLSGLSFTQSDVNYGYAFNATTTNTSRSSNNKQPTTTTKPVYAGIVSSEGKSYVYAYVAIGEGYVSLAPS